jgi:pyruvate dehydrogenase E1 component
VLGGHSPIVAASDWLKAVPDQVARWVGSPFVPLGTDGFGRSDTREALRRHFEIDAESIATASLHALALCEQYGPADVAKAIAELGIDPAKPEPRTA